MLAWAQMILRNADTQLLGEALFLPDEDLDNFGDISFGLDSILENHTQGDGSPTAKLAVEMAPPLALA